MLQRSVLKFVSRHSKKKKKFVSRLWGDIITSVEKIIINPNNR